MFLVSLVRSAISRSAQGTFVPKKTALYFYRISLDLCSMLWARRHRFNLDRPFYCHLRLDASPQFGRDYCMAEADLIYPHNVNSWRDLALGGEGVLYTRLLVGQSLGARAAGVVVKTRKLLHQLSLDSWQ